jgi:thiamine pyrophosphate-dependent acetolactate synthase large subunit-like protein
MAPVQDDVVRAAAILNAGRKIAILAGQGASDARLHLLQTAELLGAPIAKALLGKAILPDDHPYVTGGVGYLGARPSQQVFAECDTLLIVGSTFPYIEYYPKPADVRSVQIDIDSSRIGLRFPVEAGIVGDSAETLSALNALLDRQSDRRFLEQAQAWKADWYRALNEGADRPGTPMKPERVVRDLNDRLAPDAIIAADCGHHTGLTAQYIRIQEHQRFAVSGTLACMGGGLPYAIAAAFAYPGRQVVAIVGDGGLSMSVAELATCVRYQLPVKIVVLNNSSLGQIKWEQMLFLGNPEFGCGLQPVNFAAVAEGFGVRGFRLDDPECCGATLDAALAHPGPALIDAVVDANEPMLPPKRRDTYVKNLSKALKEMPERKDIERAMTEEPAVTSLRD